MEGIAMPIREEIDRAIRDFAIEEMDGDGKFYLQKIRRKLARYLEGHREDLNIREIAESYVNSYDRRQRPKLKNEESFFIPKAWIPLGNGLRVQMRHATYRQVLAWKEIEVTTFARLRNAHTEKIRYINSRLHNWGNCVNLEEVEAKFRNN